MFVCFVYFSLSLVEGRSAAWRQDCQDSDGARGGARVLAAGQRERGEGGLGYACDMI